MQSPEIRRFGLASAAVFFLITCATVIPAAPPDGELTGRYEARHDDGRLWLSMQLGRLHHSGDEMPIRAFHRRADGSVELRREAGTFVFEGFDPQAAGTQKGRLTLTPDAAYVRAMAQRGHRDLRPQQLFEAASLDLTLAFIDGLAELGYKESFERLVEMRIHRVDARYVESLAAAGYRDLPAQKLVEMRIHGVDAAYVGELAAAGITELPARRLVEMRIHGVEPVYLRQMAELGYAGLEARHWVEMRIHGVEPGWIRELSKLGYDALPARSLVEMRIHGVDPHWVGELASLGYRDLPVRQLVEMRIHGVDPEWVRGLPETGLSVRQLIDRRIHGGP